VAEVLPSRVKIGNGVHQCADFFYLRQIGPATSGVGRFLQFLSQRSRKKPVFAILMRNLIASSPSSAYLRRVLQSLNRPSSPPRNLAKRHRGI